MKKSILLAAILAILAASNLFATGTDVCGSPVTLGYGAGATITVTCSFVGNASTGSVPSAVVGSFPGWYPYQIDINPGSTAPTGYSMTLTYPVGSTAIDLMGGNGTGISAAAGSTQLLTMGGKGFRRNIGEVVTLNVTNSVASGNGSVVISWIPQ